MFLINFGYPLADAQKMRIEELLSQKIDSYYPIPVQFNNDQAFEKQVETLLADNDLPYQDLMTHPIAVILPSHAYIAVLILVELQARIGRFPAIIRFRPRPESLPLEYEVAEIVDLQWLRDQLRQKRSEP
jgi:hypothetical protein